MTANNLPPASTVVPMLRDNGMTSVPLRISVIVGVPNNVLPDLAARAPAAAAGSAPTSRPTRPSHSGNSSSETRSPGVTRGMRDLPWRTSIARLWRTVWAAPSISRWRYHRPPSPYTSHPPPASSLTSPSRS
ncbi:hypothetical protein VPH35_055815 [Triticum aestivum]|uniref:Uncharacterized protein n=1 Tax=Triticum aestivum TaxID=4565 RepID=A0A077S7R0_WHEAT|nr:unnamed protein product [Triticum aestivum]